MSSNRQSKRLYIYLMASAGALSLSATASAAADAATGESSDIIVTANKRDTLLSDTPIAVTVLTEATLDTAPITELSDLTSAAPGVVINDLGTRTGGNGTSVSIRGFGNNFGSKSLRVGILVDDVPLTGLRGLTGGLFDVSQVEVLKGPQSSLYGLTAEAGIIKITSRRPGNEFEGKASVDVSEYEQRMNLSLSTPIVKDVLAVGVSGYYGHLSGYVTNAVTGKVFDKGESWGVRGQVVFTPTEAFEAHLTYSHNEIHDDFGFNRIPINIAAYNTGLAAAGFPQRVGNYGVAIDEEGFGLLNQEQASLRLSYDLGSIVLTSVTAYQDTRLYNSFDPSFNPAVLAIGPVLLKTGEDLSSSEDIYQELRANSKGEGALTYVVGASYFRRKETLVALVNGGVGPFNPFSDNATRRTEWGVFGEATLKIADSLRATGGLRYAKSKASGILYPATRSPAALVNVERSQTDDAVLGKIGLDYKPSTDSLIYASVSRAWLPGGVNSSAAAANQLFFPTERTWTYEIGAKAKIGQGITLNGAIYQSDVRNYQEVVRTGPVTSFLAGVDKVRIRGFELEAVARVVNAFSIRGSVSYNEGTFTSFVDAGGSKTGNRVPGLPRWQWLVSAEYGAPTGLYGAAEAIGSGAFYPVGDLANAFPLADAYAVVNFKLGWRADKWQIIAYANNIADKRYFVQKLDLLGSGPGPTNFLGGTAGRPRELGIRATVSF